MSEHLRTRDLEAFAAGEPGVAGAGHIERCDSCRAQVAALLLERDELLARVPPATFVAAVAARRRTNGSRARRRAVAVLSGLGLTVAAAAGVALVLRSPPPSTQTSGVRLKGVGVHVLRKRGEIVAPLEAADRVRAGDGLRLAITLSEPAGISVWFVDRAGRVDRYPGQPQFALAAGETLLPGSVVVDDPCVDMELVVATRAGQFSRKLACE